MMPSFVNKLHNFSAQGGHEIILSPQEDNRNGQKKQPYRLLVIVFPIIAAVILLLGFVIYIYYRWMRKKKSKVQESRNQKQQTDFQVKISLGRVDMVLFTRVYYKMDKK
ncbi:hypothetical protein Q3G72_030569 [Acer saccharum]|nr:hypothetical protein Q3G72_030569 [Acer saccharum]